MSGLWTIGLLLALLVCSFYQRASCTDAHVIPRPPVHHSLQSTTSAAYVTLLYGSNEDFARSAIALGRSLLASKTELPMICLFTELPADTAERLQAVGWRLVNIEPLDNPGDGYEARFDFVFSKLAIFGLTDYDRVIYLDADCIVMQNVDELAACNANFSAVLRSAFFNAGVAVVSPSADLSADIMDFYLSTPAGYPDNDQGLLNIYLGNPERCPYFDPLDDAPSPVRQKCYRLPAKYNGDLALYALRGDRWLYDLKLHSESVNPKIVHFTFGALKPWHWWTYTLIEKHWLWWYFYAAGSVFASGADAFWLLFRAACLLPFYLIPVAVRPVSPCTLLYWAAILLVSFFGTMFFSIAWFCSPYTDWALWLLAFFAPIDIFFRSHFAGSRLFKTRSLFFATFALATFFLMFTSSYVFAVHLTFFIRLAIMITAAVLLSVVYVPYQLLAQLRSQSKCTDKTSPC